MRISNDCMRNSANTVLGIQNIFIKEFTLNVEFGRIILSRDISRWAFELFNSQNENCKHSYKNIYRVGKYADPFNKTVISIIIKHSR